MPAQNEQPKYTEKEIPSLARETAKEALRGKIQTPEQADKMMKELAYRAKKENPELAARIEAVRARLNSTLLDLIGANLTEKKAVRQKALSEINRILEPENFSTQEVNIESSEAALKSRFKILKHRFQALLYYQNEVENTDPFAATQQKLIRNFITRIENQFHNKTATLADLNASLEQLSHLLSGRDQNGKNSNESLSFHQNIDRSERTIEKRELQRRKESSLLCTSIYENLTARAPDYNYLSLQGQALVEALNKYSDLAKVGNKNYFLRAFPGLNFSANYDELGKVVNIQVQALEMGPNNGINLSDYTIYPAEKARPPFSQTIDTLAALAKKAKNIGSQKEQA